MPVMPVMAVPCTDPADCWTLLAVSYCGEGKVGGGVRGSGEWQFQLQYRDIVSDAMWGQGVMDVAVTMCPVPHGSGTLWPDATDRSDEVLNYELRLRVWW
jgi:hypothetical protein